MFLVRVWGFFYDKILVVHCCLIAQEEEVERKERRSSDVCAQVPPYHCDRLWKELERTTKDGEAERRTLRKRILEEAFLVMSIAIHNWLTTIRKWILELKNHRREETRGEMCRVWWDTIDWLDLMLSLLPWDCRLLGIICPYVIIEGDFRLKWIVFHVLIGNGRVQVLKKVASFWNVADRCWPMSVRTLTHNLTRGWCVQWHRRWKALLLLLLLSEMLRWALRTIVHRRIAIELLHAMKIGLAQFRDTLEIPPEVIAQTGYPYVIIAQEIPIYGNETGEVRESSLVELIVIPAFSKTLQSTSGSEGEFNENGLKLVKVSFIAKTTSIEIQSRNNFPKYLPDMRSIIIISNEYLADDTKEEMGNAVIYIDVRNGISSERERRIELVNVSSLIDEWLDVIRCRMTINRTRI